MENKFAITSKLEDGKLYIFAETEEKSYRYEFTTFHGTNPPIHANIASVYTDKASLEGEILLIPIERPSVTVILKLEPINITPKPQMKHCSWTNIPVFLINKCNKDEKHELKDVNKESDGQGTYYVSVLGKKSEISLEIPVDVKPCKYMRVSLEILPYYGNALITLASCNKSLTCYAMAVSSGNVKSEVSGWLPYSNKLSLTIQYHINSFSHSYVKLNYVLLVDAIY